MIEAYLEARDQWLRPGGIMLPSGGKIIAAPFSNAELRRLQLEKTAFWNQSDFHGLNLTVLRERAIAEELQKAFVGQVDPKTLVTKQRSEYYFDFRTIPKKALVSFQIPLIFEMDTDASIDGLVCWFDVDFQGSNPATSETIHFSTGPESPVTHWYQASLLFSSPLSVKNSQIVKGYMDFSTNSDNTYDIKFMLGIEGTDNSAHGKVDLYWQEFQAIPQASDGSPDYPGWTKYWSSEHNQYFYVNERSGESSWNPEE